MHTLSLPTQAQHSVDPPDWVRRVDAHVVGSYFTLISDSSRFPNGLILTSVTLLENPTTSR